MVIGMLSTASPLITAAIESGISGIRTAKAFANEAEELRKFEESNAQYRQAKRGYYGAMGAFMASTEFSVGIMPVAVIAAGGEADIVVIRNLTADDVARSVETVSAKIAESQMIFIPGGFSGGDEPDGSAKFITAFFRNPAVKERLPACLMTVTALCAVFATASRR